MTETANDQFEYWLDSLKLSTQELHDAVSADPQDVDTIDDVLDAVNLDLQQVEAFHTLKKAPYNYTLALPTISRAQRLQKKAEKILNRSRNTSTTPTQSQATSPAPAETRTRSKACDVKIPTFKGDMTLFPQFLERFDSATSGLEKPKKLFILQQNLEDEPLSLIAGLKSTDEGYDEARQTLEKSYMQQDLIKQSLRDKLRLLPKATDDAKSIRKTFTAIEALLKNLSVYEADVNANHYYKTVIMTKFPRLVLSEVNPGKIMDLPTFRARMPEVIQAREEMDGVLEMEKLSVVNSPERPELSTTPTTFAAASTSTPIKPRRDDDKNCIFCKKEHLSQDCMHYTTSQTRKEALPPYTCFKCLKSTRHSSRECRYGRPCGICKKSWHHTALCPEKFGYFDNPRRFETAQSSTSTSLKIETEAEKSVIEKPSTLNTTAAAVRERGAHLTARAILENPVTNERVYGRVFMDDGSDQTYVHESLPRLLGLESQGQSSIEVQVFRRNITEKFIADTVTFNLRSIEDSSFCITIHADTVDVMPRLMSYDPNDFIKEHPEHRNKSYLDPANNDEVIVVIGLDYHWHLLRIERTIPVHNGLFLINTVFGWAISGKKTHKEQNLKERSVHISIQKSIEKIWSLDSIGIAEPNISREREEERALEQFYRNVTYDAKENRYEITWPWRDLSPNLPTNFALAKGCLMSLLRQYQSKQRYLQIADDIFAEQLKTGIIERVDLDKSSERVHYLPFHFVICEEKTTPVRIVYNGSAKTRKENLSLNDCLYKGTNTLPNMIHLLLRFQLKQTAIVGDIEKAFHQILLKERERDAVRFLWIDRTRDDAPILIYRFRRVPFGIISSPFILAAVITFLLRQSSDTQAINENIYVDNLLMSMDTPTEALNVYETSVKTFKKAGMNIRCWTSNSKEVVQHIPENLREERLVIGVLGLKWNMEKDNFVITAAKDEFKDTKKCKRHVLSYTAMMYDPLGWFNPIVMKAKVLIRTLHERNCEWKTPLDEKELEIWSDIYADMQRATTVPVPRCLQPVGKPLEHQLHCFSDASQNVYATVIYLRTVTEDGVNVSLIMSKARVAPLKRDDRMTIPRLELMAALLAVRMLKLVREGLQLEHEKPPVLWIDSQVVLQWLTTTNILPTFVRNRVLEIKTIKDLQSRYIPGEENIADLPTRMCTTEELRNNHTWWNGPTWLSLSPPSWPEEWHPSKDEIPESNTIMAVSKIVETRKSPLNIDLQKYNSYKVLMKVMMYCIKFARKIFNKWNLKQSKPQSKQVLGGNLSALDYATLIWIRSEQANEFATEINILKNKKKSNMLIKRLRLQLDEHGLIRCQGRYEHLQVPVEEKFPVLIPRPTKSRFSLLYVQFVHETLCHAGQNITYVKVFDKYYFTCGKQEITNFVYKCRACQRENAKPYTQPEGSDLPFFRMDSKQFPFTNVGMDTSGPFKILQEKKYILLVTCLVTRGISLEVLDSLETHIMHAALRRIQARRNQATKFYLSDNAKQFKLLKLLVTAQNLEDVDWKFIQEYSPWQGGAYERLNAVFKSSVYRTLHSKPYCGPVQFTTIIAEIEAMLNDRPLTSTDAEIGLCPLTPNHFLRVRYEPLESIENRTPFETPVAKSLLETHNKIAETLRMFWNVWRRNYLQYLRERPATSNLQNSRRPGKQRSPKVGDVVIIRDDILKRSQWKLGKVQNLIPSRDGIVRAAEVLVATQNVTVRPLKHLYYLEINEVEEAEKTHAYALRDRSTRQNE